MLSTAEINNLSRQRARILVLAITIGILAICGYFVVAALVRDPLIDMTRQRIGKTAAEFTPLVLIVPSILFFLAPLVWAEKKSKRFALICPECNSDLTRLTKKVIVTGCCSSCGIRIVQDGRIRSPDVFDRYSRMKQRRFLVYWFWAWPVVGALVLVLHTINPSALANCIHVLFIPGLIGTAASGWAFARTTDRRYLPQLGASAIVLTIGVTMFWNTV